MWKPNVFNLLLSTNFTTLLFFSECKGTNTFLISKFICNFFQKILKLNCFQNFTAYFGLQRYEYFFNLQIYLQVFFKNF